MPRGIPGSGKAAKKPATSEPSLPALPIQAKRKYTRKATTNTAVAAPVTAPKVTSRPQYTDLERFAAAQAYLLTLAEAAIKLDSLHAGNVGLGEEIQATITILTKLREGIFGMGAESVPEEVSAVREEADKRIRQHIPMPTQTTSHVGPPVHTPVVQQAPFVPGATPPRMQ